MSVWADNFLITQGETIKIFSPRTNGEDTQRADRLFADDYHEVFGSFLSHTNRIEEAKIIVGNYDSPDVQKYAKIRGLSFESLAHEKEAFVLKVHNNGKQLFVVGSDDRGTAFGLMTLSRIWGVSPFRWWLDAPALPQPSFELGVAYEQLFKPSIPKRTMIIEGAQQHDNYLLDLLLRLRVSGMENARPMVDELENGIFSWSLQPAVQPYLGLNLALDHPERIRMEALRALAHDRNREWQFEWGHQFGGELQLFLFFDMAWDVDAYRDAYSVDQLEDLHFSQVSGIDNNWSRIWNDYFDLTMMLWPAQPLSLEALRRGIGESQSLGLQLSLDLSEKSVAPAYANAFFRAVEYPLNMTSAQIQRLCNMQLVQHGMAKPWAVDDCRQRMELLASEMPGLILPKWRQMLGAVPVPQLDLRESLMQIEQGKQVPLVVGSKEPLPSELASGLLYRGKRAIGTLLEPFEPFRLPVDYHDDSLHVCLSFLPVKSYGKAQRCLVTVDKGVPQLIELSAQAFPETQQIFNLVFATNPNAIEHEIVIRTQSEGIYLQRVWINEMKYE